MTFSELTRLARELESSDPYDRGSQKSSLERLLDLRKQARQKCAPEVATCIGAVSQLVDALTRSQESISREQVKGIACRMLYALGNDLGELPNRPDEEPATPAEAAAPSVQSPPREVVAAPAPTAAPRAVPEQPLPRRRPAKQPLHPRMQRSDMTFGRMLVELGHVTRDQVATALRFHRSRGPRIGECLLLMGSIAPEHLLNALKIQDLLRSTPHGITPETLARYKQPATPEPAQPEAQESSQSSDQEPEPPAPVPARPPDAAQRVTEGIFLGEVLLGADMITNDQLEKALHLHHHEGVRVGEALVQLGALSEQDVQAGIELQEQLRYIAGLPSVQIQG